MKLTAGHEEQIVAILKGSEIFKKECVLKLRLRDNFNFEDLLAAHYGVNKEHFLDNEYDCDDIQESFYGWLMIRLELEVGTWSRDESTLEEYIESIQSWIDLENPNNKESCTEEEARKFDLDKNWILGWIEEAWDEVVFVRNIR